MLVGEALSAAALYLLAGLLLFLFVFCLGRLCLHFAPCMIVI